MSQGVSRRRVLGWGLVAAGAPLLAACGSSSSGDGGSGPLKFWDMPWGGDSYQAAEKALVAGYAPTGGLPGVSYQQIQWENFYQTFSSAVAAKSGPAVSSGGGFQAFQLADQGAIAYADNVVAELKKNGLYDDFLPGYLESFKTAKGYVAIPWSIDMRVLWYRKSLLDQAGVAVPTDWDSLRAAGLALKKIGVFGFGTGAGAGNAIGNQSIISMIMNNGGGLFDEQGRPNCVTDENIQAVDFIVGLAKDGIVDPNSVSYTTANLQAQWKNKKFGIGIYTPGLRTDTGETGEDLLVPSPLTGPTGKKGTVVYIPNLMMYTNTPSQPGSEAFLVWYLQNMKAYWAKEVIPLLPVLKSIAATPEFQKNTTGVKITQEWAPIAKTLAARSSSQFSALAAVDGGSAINAFAQTVLAGKTPAKDALQTLEKGIREVVK